MLASTRAQAEHPSIPVQRQLGLRHVVATVVIREEGLGAILLPLHRPLQPPTGPRRQGLLEIHERLHAEGAADIRRDHAQRLAGQLQDGVR